MFKCSNIFFFCSQSCSSVWIRCRLSQQKCKTKKKKWRSFTIKSKFFPFVSAFPSIEFTWTDGTEVIVHLSVFKILKYLLIVIIFDQTRKKKNRSQICAHVNNITEVNRSSNMNNENLLSHGQNHKHKLFMPFLQGV